jgi:cell division septal protein FtsQ
VQTGPQKEILTTTYLAELINIAADPPTPIAYFNPQLAEKRLLASPVIKEAKVELIEPDTIYIDYTVRQPWALLRDFENTAIDEFGYPFPISPFSPPKNLPLHLFRKD